MRVRTALTNCDCQGMRKVTPGQPCLLILRGNTVGVHAVDGARISDIAMPVAAWLPYRLKKGEMWLCKIAMPCPAEWTPEMMEEIGILPMLGMVINNVRGTAWIWRDHGAENQERQAKIKDVERELEKRGYRRVPMPTTS